MKVLLLAHELAHGGVGTLNYELATELSKLGVEITVVTHKATPFAHAYTRNGIKIHELYGPKTPPRDILFCLLNAKKITDIAKAEKPDIIHDSSSMISFSPWLSKLAPVVATVHGSPLLSDLRLAHGTLDDWFRDRAFSFAHRVPSALIGLVSKPQVRRLVFVSKSCLADTVAHMPRNLRKGLIRKASVIYNGVSLEGFSSLRSRALHDHPNRKVMFLSRLMEYKGADRAIKAFSIVAKEVPGAELHIVGSGPQLTKLVDLCRRVNSRGKIVFHGWLSRCSALDVMATVALLAHPSLYESFGYVLAEAYALGKPVIAHRAPYSVELVEAMNSGMTVDTFDANTFADAMVSLLSDKGLYERVSQNAIRASEEHFNIKNTALKYLRVYEEAFNNDLPITNIR